MRLVRFGPPGGERPGVLRPDGVLVDVSAAVDEFDPAFFDADGWLERVAAAAAQGVVVPGGARLGPPIAGISKIVGLGMNYHEGVARLGLPPPAEPLLFIKSATSIAAPCDPIRLPPGAEKLDWEVELAVILARPLHRATMAEAEAAIAGYAVLNDLSERRWQNEQGGEWCKGKSADGFAPLGPWLVTPDEAGNADSLDIWLTLNGRTMQRSSTSDMIVGVRQALVYASRFMRLLPCDVIAMGTPPGTGQRQVPPLFLKAGDRLQLGIERLGEQEADVIPE